MHEFYVTHETHAYHNHDKTHKYIFRLKTARYWLMLNLLGYRLNSYKNKMYKIKNV